MSVEKIRNTTFTIHGSLGLPIARLEKERIYYYHEYINGKKNGVYLVKYIKESGNDIIFEKKESNQIVKLVWGKNIDKDRLNRYWESSKQTSHLTVISDR